MKSTIIVVVIMLNTLLTWNCFGQRYFEFHFPPNTGGCKGCPGLPAAENFIVKIADTSLYPLADQDLLLHDSLKQYQITGYIASSNGGYNLNWNWHYRSDTGMWLNNGAFGGCDWRPSYIDSSYISSNGMFCPWGARLNTEIFITSIALNEKDKVEKHILLFPNPISESAIVRIRQFDPSMAGRVHFEITDAVGKRIADELFPPKGELVLHRRIFPVPGIYLYVVRSHDTVLGSGKIIVN